MFSELLKKTKIPLKTIIINFVKRNEDIKALFQFSVFKSMSIVNAYWFYLFIYLFLMMEAHSY